MNLSLWQATGLITVLGIIISFLVALIIKGLSLLLRLVEQK